MSRRQRRIMVLLSVVISLTLLAAPARSADWFGIHVGSDGFGVSIGSSDWWVYGQAWSDPEGYGSYESALGGYGAWLEVEGLGRCWRPSVTADWRPYTYGRWISTPLGWTWVAYEPWGYFPHHYGTWALTRFGWVWVPGYEYRPANVVWVQTSAYVGWYPRGPRGWSHAARSFERGYRRGYGRGYDHGYDNGYEDGWREAQYATYVQWRHLGDADLAHYAVARETACTTAGRRGLRVSGEAPSRSEIRRRGGIDVPETHVSRRTLRIGGRSVIAVRPEGMDAAVRRYAPEAVERALVPEVRRRVTTEPPAARPAPRPAPSSQRNRLLRATPTQRTDAARPVTASPGPSEPRWVQTRTSPTRSSAPRSEPTAHSLSLSPRRAVPSARGSRDQSRTRSEVTTRQAPSASSRRVTRPTAAHGNSSGPPSAPHASTSRSDDAQRSETATRAPERRESATGPTQRRAPSRQHAAGRTSKSSRTRSHRR